MLSILVVDDSEPFVAETVESLRYWGWSAEGASNGQMAQEILSSGRHFDGVLLDQSMPKSSGIEVLRWIRGEALKDPRIRPNVQDLCVVMLTGYGAVRNAVEALKLGAFQYLEKPMKDAEHLRSILAAGIALRRAHVMRRDLLVTPGRHELFARVRSILLETLRPAPEGVHIMFVDENGSIEEIVGEPARPTGHGKRPFVERLLAGEQLVFEQKDKEVVSLGPILRDAKTLMAVPVPGSERLVGVLDMESTAERAFDPCWSEVLSYLADLIGIAMEIEAQTAKRVMVEAEKNAEREKLRQLGTLYREFRHSIATHAQIVSMQARELLETDMAGAPDGNGDGRIRQRLTYIKNNAEIIEGVVQDLKKMSLSPPKPNLEPVDLDSVVQESVEIFQPRLGRDVELRLVKSTPHIQIQADRANLAYCLKCLLQNSLEAIEEARRTDDKQHREVADRIELQVTEEKDDIRVMVLDSGIGFDSPAEDLFQPLYSTKTRRPTAEKQVEAAGADRVTDILEFLAKWSTQQSDSTRFDGIGKGADILIRDGDALTMYVRKGSASDSVTIGEFQKTAKDRIVTHLPRTEWPNRGVGLYSVRRIVEDMHGGKIIASSDGLGKGAAFTMLLPKSL